MLVRCEELDVFVVRLLSAFFSDLELLLLVVSLFAEGERDFGEVLHRLAEAALLGEDQGAIDLPDLYRLVEVRHRVEAVSSECLHLGFLAEHLVHLCAELLRVEVALSSLPFEVAH